MVLPPLASSLCKKTATSSQVRAPHHPQLAAFLDGGPWHLTTQTVGLVGPISNTSQGTVCLRTPDTSPSV